MTTTNGTINSIKGTSTLVRARFGPGMLLQHEDLEQLNAYTRELSRLLFRSFFGCGVVCGLVVEPKEKCGKVIVTVFPGLALECSGDPVHLPRAQTLAIDEECNPNLPNRLWVLLCGNSKCCSPRTPVCASDEDESPSVCTRERDGFEIRIVSTRPPCICGCKKPYDYDDVRENKCGCVDPSHPCYQAHYAGQCGCHGGEECDCSCECILLAQLDKPYEGDWTVDYSVRRFIRPVLMRDPEAAKKLEETTPAPPTPSPEPETKDQPAKGSRTTRSKPRL